MLKFLMSHVVIMLTNKPASENHGLISLCASKTHGIRPQGR